MEMDETLETTTTVFDPAGQPLDLTKDEKRRTTALMLAIQAWSKTIIPDAAYLTAAADLARRGEGPALRACDMDALCVTAAKFDAFIERGATVQVVETETEPDGEA